MSSAPESPELDRVAEELARLLCEACDYTHGQINTSSPLVSLPNFDSLEALKFQIRIADRFEIDPIDFEAEASLLNLARRIIAEQGRIA